MCAKGIISGKPVRAVDKNLIASVGEGRTIQRYKNMGYEKKFFFGGT